MKLSSIYTLVLIITKLCFSVFEAGSYIAQASYMIAMCRIPEPLSIFATAEFITWATTN